MIWNHGAKICWVDGRRIIFKILVVKKHWCMLKNAFFTAEWRIEYFLSIQLRLECAPWAACKSCQSQHCGDATLGKSSTIQIKANRVQFQGEMTNSISAWRSLSARVFIATSRASRNCTDFEHCYQHSVRHIIITIPLSQHTRPTHCGDSWRFIVPVFRIYTTKVGLSAAILGASHFRVRWAQGGAKSGNCKETLGVALSMHQREVILL